MLVGPLGHDIQSIKYRMGLSENSVILDKPTLVMPMPNIG
jgi:hypothetical protein